MYKLEYLLVAQRDMVEIVRYISGKLQKPDAADCLVMELVNVAERVITFPYALPAYQPIRLLKREYRKILVQNFLMFYWVDEEKKLVTVARVMYAKRDIGRLLLRKKVSHLVKAPKLDIVSVIREAPFAILSEWVQLKFQVAERRKSGIMNK